MLISKLQIIILGIVLIIHFWILAYIEKGDNEIFYEDELHDFYENYVINNNAFPIEYRCDIECIHKIIELIKMNPDKYNIPLDKVNELDILIKFASGHEEIKKKIQNSTIFIGMTLFALILNMILTTI